MTKAERRKFEIHATMPSGNMLTLTFYGNDENDADMNYVFDALYAAARYNLKPGDEPKIIELVEQVLK